MSFHIVAAGNAFNSFFAYVVRTFDSSIEPAGGCLPGTHATEGRGWEKHSGDSKGRSRKLLSSTIIRSVRLVAAISRMSTFFVRVLPKRSNSPSCKTRRRLGLEFVGISPTSSRNNVPRGRPVQVVQIFCVTAPVKAPSRARIAHSSKPVGIAAQLSFTKVRSLRRLRS